ncbi:MAG TPA: NAD-dependent isocitrate dehydrogenase [Myxococcales bacterium]|nr:isocitrate dehydrogenase [Myxococcales bacterium]HAN31702.1 NAD-dependent isocitrate dehydrogenase [Myxococcales bacterium]
MSYEFTLIAGDGIGPEVTNATIRVLEATGVEIKWIPVATGAAAVAEFGTPLPDETLRTIEKTRVALKGPITTPVGHGFTSVNVAIRQALDLYVSLRPVRSIPGIKTRHEDVDLVVFRENTEGLYSGREHSPVPGVVETLRVISERACSRICKWANDFVRNEGRSKLTLVHKASIMKLSDGLFLDAFTALSDDYPFVEHEARLVDDVVRELVIDPSQFDCMVMENLYGDVLSDLCAGLVGGLGVVPGANIGDRFAVFEAVHGSAPDIAGRGIANPTALIQSSVLLLRHIGERKAADSVEQALFSVLSEGKIRTGDLGGSADTRVFTDAVIEQINRIR